MLSSDKNEAYQIKLILRNVQLNYEEIHMENTNCYIHGNVLDIKINCC